MSNYNQLSNDYVVDVLNNISDENKSSMRYCVDQLNQLLEENKISESTLRKLANIISELTTIKDLFFIRILNCLKRGDRLLD